MNKQVYVFGGPTFSDGNIELAKQQRPSLVSVTLANMFVSEASKQIPNLDVKFELTGFSDPGSNVFTARQLLERVHEIVNANPIKILILAIDGNPDVPVSYLETIRRNRKDIFLVVSHFCDNLTEEQQYSEALRICKGGSCNLVFSVNNESKRFMVVTPEEARYHQSSNLYDTVAGMIDIANKRSQLTFTQSTVVEGNPIPWNSEEVPNSLRAVVNHCIAKKAYKPFGGVTAGHFAVKLNDTTFLTSIRKTDFNDLPKTGLVKVVTDGPDTVLAYGAKPSVGGQSQRRIFRDHPGMDCVVHFHCPIKQGSAVPVASQREIECGSHQCGENTSSHLKQFGNLMAVYLDNHGPNIVFNSSIDPKEVIDFIEDNFDLSQKTGGFVSEVPAGYAEHSFQGVQTWEDLLVVLSQTDESLLKQRIQVFHDVHNEEVATLMPCVAIGTVDQMELRYARSSVDNRRNGGEFVLQVGKNPFDVNGATGYRMVYDPKTTWDTICGIVYGFLTDLAKLFAPRPFPSKDFPVFPKTHSAYSNWTGPAQQLLDKSTPLTPFELTKIRPTMASEINGRIEHHPHVEGSKSNELASRSN